MVDAVEWYEGSFRRKEPMIKNKDNLDGKEVILKFPPPKSSIAANPMHEEWHGRLELGQSSVAAVFKTSGLDPSVKIILNDEHVTSMIARAGASGDLVLRTSSSPEDMKSGLHGLI